MMEAMKQLVKNRDDLAAKALPQYQFFVEQYIRDNCKDTVKITFMLDFMLDFFYAPMLYQYRKLCNHLFSLDPKAAVFYVDAYRERWDEEDKEFGNI